MCFLINPYQNYGYYVTDIQSGYPTAQGTVLTATPSQVDLASDAVGIFSSGMSC